LIRLYNQKKELPVKISNPLVPIIAIIILISLTLSLSGCWDRREPDVLGFITMAAFDIKPDSGLFRVIVQVANPLGEEGGQQEGGGGGGKKPPFWVVEATGHTIYEAIKNLEVLSSRKLVWTHNEAVLFSEELSRKGIRRVLDFLDREREPRPTARPFVVQGDVRRLLEADFPLEETGATAVSKQLFSIRLERSVLPDVESLRILFHHLAAPGLELILPRIAVLEQEGKDREKSGRINPARISGAAVFRGDRLVGFLDDRETSGYLWLKGDVSRATLVLKCPGSEEELLTVEVFESDAKLEPKIEGDRVRFKASIRAESSIQEFACRDLPLEEEFINSLNRRMAIVIRNEIAMSLEKARELEADVFGLGNIIYRTRPRDWKRLEEKWEEIFPAVMVDIEVEAVIRRYGLVLEPIKIR
jgi:spore germination protein KC